VARWQGYEKVPFADGVHVISFAVGHVIPFAVGAGMGVRVLGAHTSVHRTRQAQ
jgi:hypothetical protein